MRTLLFAVCSAATLAANVCDAGPEVRKALRQWDEGDGRIPFAERRAQLDTLAAKYPEAIEVQDQRLWIYRIWRLDPAAAREALVRRAAAEPEDPLALTLAAMYLHRADTPRALEYAKRAQTASPGYPWAALLLAEIHASGKFADPGRARTEFAAFVKACPDRLPRRLDWLPGKLADPELPPRMARAMRARLEAETDPGELLDYDRLWALEFRVTPPQDHAAVRQRIAADVARLSKLESSDAAFLDVLYSGAKQSEAPPEKVAALASRLMAGTPRGYPAYSLAHENWTKAHPEPADQTDKPAWDAWKQLYAAAAKQWSEEFPGVYSLRESYLRAAIETGTIGEKDAIAEFEQVQQRGKILLPPEERRYTLLEHGSMLVKFGWSPAKALSWLGEAWTEAEQALVRDLADDTLTEKQREDNPRDLRLLIAADYLKALLDQGGKTVPGSMRLFLERAKAPGTFLRTRLLWARARLAEVDGRTADSLAYYQAAMRERAKTPGIYRGVAYDDVAPEAKAAFLRRGGSEAGLAVWLAAEKPGESSEGRWEKPTQQLPAFELSDLQGKTWKLTQLEGKAVLINLWATWCGPCRVELPHVQRLFEQTKARADLQVITFNLDSELGLVQPFLKEHGYTFPVLLANDLVTRMFDGYGIPQNWIVDPKGRWIATQVGFDASEKNWVEAIVQRLEKAAQAKEGVVTPP